MVFLKDNPPKENENYRTDRIVRKVWNIEIIDKYTGFSETYYVDATTGEIIGETEKLINVRVLLIYF